MLRERSEGQRRDKPQRVGRHDDVHISALFGQAARQIRRLVSGNGARHAQNDVFGPAHLCCRLKR